MRVLLLTAGGPWSGVEVHTINLAHAFKERGHDVAIVELGRNRYGEAPQPLSCRVIHCPIGPDNSGEIPLESLGFKAWRKIFSSLHADVAISVKGTFKFGSLSMEAAGRLCFPRFLVVEHLHAPLGKRPPVRFLKGPLPSLGLWWYREKLEGFLRSIFPHKVVCVSQAVASTLKDDYCYPSSKLVAVYSGVDTDLFVPSPLLRSEAREAWGIPENAFVFGTVGRLSPMKNHGQLISAFLKLRESGGSRDIWLVIVGDGPLRTSLESLASTRGGGHVLLPGFSAEPQKMCPGFDVFCFPSSTGESLGIALLEAMACGCPPIAAAVGGVPEILNDSFLGWLVPSGDEDALFSAMHSAMNLDQDTLQRKGAKARERVKRNFNAIDRWIEFVTVVETASSM
jgi:glycosyltransferase involved in cell wall biosynthesis